MKSNQFNPDALLETALNSIRDRTGWSRQQAATMLGAFVLAGLILFCGLATAIGSAIGQPAPTPTAIPLPTRSASDVLGYLKQAGVALNSVQPLTVPNNNWQAVTGTQFIAQIKDKQGRATVLSYPDVSKAGVDAFLITNNPKFKGWAVVQLSNVLLVMPPDIDANVHNALVSHLTTYLVAPYRPILPTATP